MPLAKDLLNPSIEEEKGKCKLKRLVQSPNSYFMDVKCPGCYKVCVGEMAGGGRDGKVSQMLSESNSCFCLPLNF